MNRNVILLTQFSQVYSLTNSNWNWNKEQKDVTNLLILICIHKSYIIYFELYVVPIGHGFSFFGHGNVMENQC